MSNVTAEQVRNAMQAANITYVEHHTCSLCGYMTNYFVGGDGVLYFDPGSDCSRGRYRELGYESAADWINMQSDEGVRQRIAAKFGLAGASQGPEPA
jgi:hypothetical protein